MAANAAVLFSAKCIADNKNYLYICVQKHGLNIIIHIFGAMNHTIEPNLFNEFCNNFATNVENFLEIDNSNGSLSTSNTNTISSNTISNEDEKLQLSTESSPSISVLNILDSSFPNYQLHSLNQFYDCKHNENYATYGGSSNQNFESSLQPFENLFPSTIALSKQVKDTNKDYKYTSIIQQGSKNKLVGNIYHYSENSPSKYKKIGHLKLKKNVLNCYLISKSIKSSINKELKLEELYERELNSGKMQYIKGRIKKRRNPIADELIWEPLSLFTAFTNFKTSHFENTDYFENIPKTSCVGKINMRMKRAWVRGPNKERLEKKKRLSF